MRTHTPSQKTQGRKADAVPSPFAPARRVNTTPASAAVEAPDLATQLQQARDHGHSFGKMVVQARGLRTVSPSTVRPVPVQRKAIIGGGGVVQCEGKGEMEEEKGAAESVEESRKKLLATWRGKKESEQKPTEKELAGRAELREGGVLPLNPRVAVLGTDYQDKEGVPTSMLIRKVREAQEQSREPGSGVEPPRPSYLTAHLYNKGVDWSPEENKGFVDKIAGESDVIHVTHKKVQKLLSGESISEFNGKGNPRKKINNLTEFVKHRKGKFGVPEEVHSLISGGTHEWDGKSGVLRKRKK